MTKINKDDYAVHNITTNFTIEPILINGSTQITNVFTKQYYITSAYQPGDDIHCDISITNASKGGGNWFATCTMNGVNSTEGSYSTQFIINCSIINNDTIRVWLHCLFGSNSNSSTKLYFTVMAWKGL